MATKPTRKRAAKKLARKSMKGTKGGLIGLLMPSSMVKSPGTKLGSQTPEGPSNLNIPVPCV